MNCPGLGALKAELLQARYGALVAAYPRERRL